VAPIRVGVDVGATLVKLAIQGPEGGIVPSVKKRTRGIELSLSHQVPVTVEPRDFGLGCEGEPDMPMFGPPEEGQGSGDNPALVQAAGDVNLAVLAGEHGPARNATLLGAALILKAAGRCHTLAEGVSEATEALDSGEASAVLERQKSHA
jgi:anthranilate phosphoribosyltransferase